MGAMVWSLRYIEEKGIFCRLTILNLMILPHDAIVPFTLEKLFKKRSKFSRKFVFFCRISVAGHTQI
ncbi:hypothetical protein CCP2SC5_1200004 [Azospirillaceae bacterium]